MRSPHKGMVILLPGGTGKGPRAHLSETCLGIAKLLVVRCCEAWFNVRQKVRLLSSPHLVDMNRPHAIATALRPATAPENVWKSVDQCLSVGDTSKADELLPMVYEQLRKLAQKQLSREPVGLTLQATALVHEAYMRITKKDPNANWNGLPHFFGAAAMAMRRILVERARQKKTQRRGGGTQIDRSASIEDLSDPEVKETVDLLALNEALDRLAVEHPRKVKLVELRFFLGMTNQEAAQLLGISTSTADLDWRYARSWLKLEMDDAS